MQRSEYVIRTQPDEHGLCTLEVVAHTLRLAYRPNGEEVCEKILKPLRALCAMQLQFGAVVHEDRASKAKSQGGPTADEKMLHNAKRSDQGMQGDNGKEHICEDDHIKAIKTPVASKVDVMGKEEEENFCKSDSLYPILKDCSIHSNHSGSPGDGTHFLSSAIGADELPSDSAYSCCRHWPELSSSRLASSGWTSPSSASVLSVRSRRNQHCNRVQKEKKQRVPSFVDFILTSFHRPRQVLDVAGGR